MYPVLYGLFLVSILTNSAAVTITVCGSLCVSASVSVGESPQGGLTEAESVFFNSDGCYSHILHIIPLRNFKSGLIYTFDTELLKEDASIRSIFITSTCACSPSW